METQFYILLSLKTTQGYVDYGQYFFGDDREAAYQLFRQLKHVIHHASRSAVAGQPVPHPRRLTETWLDPAPLS